MAKKNEQLLWIVGAGVALAAVYFMTRKPPLTIQTQVAPTPLQSSALLPSAAPGVSSIISRLAGEGAGSSITPISVPPMGVPSLDIQAPGQNDTSIDFANINLNTV